MTSICCAKKGNGNVCVYRGKYQYPNTEHMFCGIHVKKLLVERSRMDTFDVKIKYDTIKSKFVMGNKTLKEINDVLNIYKLGQFYTTDNITRGKGRCIITSSETLNNLNDNNEFEFSVNVCDIYHNYDSISRYYIIIEKFGENNYNINGIGEFNYDIFVPNSKKMIFRKLTENETTGFWKNVEISEYIVENELYDNSVVINKLKSHCNIETIRANTSENLLNSTFKELTTVKNELQTEKIEHETTKDLNLKLIEMFEKQEKNHAFIKEKLDEKLEAEKKDHRITKEKLEEKLEEEKKYHRITKEKLEEKLEEEKKDHRTTKSYYFKLMEEFKQEEKDHHETFKKLELEKFEHNNTQTYYLKLLEELKDKI